LSMTIAIGRTQIIDMNSLALRKISQLQEISISTVEVPSKNANMESDKKKIKTITHPSKVSIEAVQKKLQHASNCKLEDCGLEVCKQMRKLLLEGAEKKKKLGTISKKGPKSAELQFDVKEGDPIRSATSSPEFNGWKETEVPEARRILSSESEIDYNTIFMSSPGGIKFTLTPLPFLKIRPLEELQHKYASPKEEVVKNATGIDAANQPPHDLKEIICVKCQTLVPRDELEKHKALIHATDDQTVCVKPKRQDGVKESVRRLAHACQCNLKNCSQEGCSEMKKLVIHSGTCKLRPQGGCRSCRYLVAVCVSHAKTCHSLSCAIPFCNSVKEKIKVAKRLIKPLRAAKRPAAFSSAEILPPKKAWLQRSLKRSISEESKLSLGLNQPGPFNSKKRVVHMTTGAEDVEETKNWPLVGYPSSEEESEEEDEIPELHIPEEDDKDDDVRVILTATKCRK